MFYHMLCSMVLHDYEETFCHVLLITVNSTITHEYLDFFELKFSLTRFCRTHGRITLHMNNFTPILRQVFLEEPSKLYTMDMRKASMHLVGGGKYSAMPENKNYIAPPTPAPAPRAATAPKRERKTILPPGV